MPSIAYRRWRTARAKALDEIAGAHAAVGGTGWGRRYATEQLNHAYAVLLASQFQGFCRDLHTEGANHLLTVMAPTSSLWPIIELELLRGRQLDRGNAQPASIGADFGRLGLELWPAVDRLDSRNVARRSALEMLNNWRNAVAHQDFDPAKLGGTTTLQLTQVRKWRAICGRLARAFDDVVHAHLLMVTLRAPW